MEILVAYTAETSAGTVAGSSVVTIPHVGNAQAVVVLREALRDKILKDGFTLIGSGSVIILNMMRLSSFAD